VNEVVNLNCELLLKKVKLAKVNIKSVPLFFQLPFEFEKPNKQELDRAQE
jgi:hypothetical protein